MQPLRKVNQVRDLNRFVLTHVDVHTQQAFNLTPKNVNEYFEIFFFNLIFNFEKVADFPDVNSRRNRDIPVFFWVLCLDARREGEKRE